VTWSVMWSKASADDELSNRQVRQVVMSQLAGIAEFRHAPRVVADGAAAGSGAPGRRGPSWGGSWRCGTGVSTKRSMVSSVRTLKPTRWPTRWTEFMDWDANCLSGGESAGALDALITEGSLDVALDVYGKRHLHLYDWEECAQHASADTGNLDVNDPDSVWDEGEE
jgi:hypothetical protein